MDGILIIIEIILIVVGLAGCFLPGLPGIPLVYGAVLVQHFFDEQIKYNVFLLIGLGVIVALVMVGQYLLPSFTTKKVGASKYAVWGAVIGLIIGIFTSYLGPFGILIGPFLGASLGEFLFARKGVAQSLKAGLAAFIGVLGSSVMEFIFSIMVVVVYLIHQF